jgi:hypothetical protein
MASDPELRINSGAKASIRLVLSKAITYNQLLILTSIDNGERSLSSLLKELSRSHGIPLSTLKLSAKSLRQLELITLIQDFSSSRSSVAVTEGGAAVAMLILDDKT